MNPAPERVGPGLLGGEGPVRRVLDPLLVVRVTAADLRLGRLEQQAVADLLRVEVHRVAEAAAAAVGGRVVDAGRTGARQRTPRIGVPDSGRCVLVPEPGGLPELQQRDPGLADDAEVCLAVGEARGVDVRDELTILLGQSQAAAW